ncbi:MAG: GreA/GreB family elongation factor [Candidatus Gottesmanbacteria bacterium]|nr:GreA/GreB family elongation factor [Candidatus Gottesmanbacteria bacterium]
MKKLLLKKEPKISFTKAGYQKLLEDRAKFLAARPEAVEHLRKSREMGDLSENGYYKASRQQLSFLDSRIRRVERLIKLARIIEPTRVKISDGKNECEYHIVGGYESDPVKHTISEQSPLGRAITGKKAGDEVDVITPGGIKKYTIVSIS